MQMRWGIITAALLVAMVALSYYVWPRNYAYTTLVEPGEVTINFNRAIEIDEVLISRIIRDKVNTANGYQMKMRVVESSSIDLNAEGLVNSISLSIPHLLENLKNAKWSGKPIVLKPGNSYMVGWYNDPIISGFDMTTTGALAW